MPEALPLLWRQYRFERHLFWRNPSAAFFNFLLPLIFLALFGAIVSGNHHELQIIVPGIAGMSVMSTTFTALAYNLTFLREQGVLKRMRGTPLPSGIFLGGLALNAVTNAAIQIAHRGRGRARVLRPRLAARRARAGRSSWSPAWSASPPSASPSRTRSPTSSRRRRWSTPCSCPVILISGVFFDVKHVPSFLRDIAQALPLDHLIDRLSGGLVAHHGSISSHLTALVGDRRSGRSSASCSRSAASPGRRAATWAGRRCSRPRARARDARAPAAARARAARRRSRPSSASPGCRRRSRARRSSACGRAWRISTPRAAARARCAAAPSSAGRSSAATLHLVTEADWSRCSARPCQPALDQRDARARRARRTSIDLERVASRRARAAANTAAHGRRAARAPPRGLPRRGRARARLRDAHAASPW